MSKKGKKAKRNRVRTVRTFFTAAPNTHLKELIDAYINESSQFCIGKTYSHIIDDYCKIFTGSNRKRIRRQYTIEELNTLFTIKNTQDAETT